MHDELPTLPIERHATLLENDQPGQCDLWLPPLWAKVQRADRNGVQLSTNADRCRAAGGVVAVAV
jgi:hypothetical protein